MNITRALKKSIGIRTSCICGAIVMLMLGILTVILIHFQTGLMDYVVSSYSSSVNKAIDEQGDNRKKDQISNFKAATKIAAGLAAQYLYNVDSDLSAKAFRVYMNLPGIVAVSIVDSDNQPFIAVWKDSKIKVGTSLPEKFINSKELMSEKADAVFEGEKQGTLELLYTDKLLEKQLEDGRQNAFERIQKFRKNTDHKIKNAQAGQVSMLFIVVLVLIGTIIWSLHHTAIKPIRKVRDGLKDVARGEGDLTARLNIKNMDEVGELASWFNIFIEQLQKIIFDIFEKAKNLDLASEDISGLSEQMSARAEGLSGNSNNVTAAAKEMTVNMNSLALSIEDASTRLTMVAAASEEMISTIQEIASNSGKAKKIGDHAVSQAESATIKVKELGMAAQEIDLVTETITEISDQTNLLALNATIEAARAGDAGKGFAVVANEIKELAKQTSDSTLAIKNKINGIRNSAQEATKVISKISEVINDIADIISTIAGSIEEQSIATNEISKNVSQISSGIQEVNLNVSKSSNASGEISMEIENVNKTVKDMSDGSEMVKNNAGDLSILASALREQITKFKF